MPGAWTQLHVHFVYCTYGRRELIEPEWEDRLYGFFGGIARDERCQLVIGNGMAEHVHLLVRHRADITVADLAKHLKSRTTKWINGERLTKQRFSWKEGYGAFSVGTATLPTVKRYIARQKEHHMKLTFSEEVALLLERAGMSDRLGDALGED